MNREVVLTDEAESLLNEAADWYAERSRGVADDWFNGIVSSINELSTEAERFGLARENNVLPCEMRERNFGLGKRITHRILYSIRPEKIVVHHIRHVAQRDITEADL